MSRKIYLRTFVERYKLKPEIIDKIVLSSGHLSYDCVKNEAYPINYLIEFVKKEKKDE